MMEQTIGNSALKRLAERIYDQIRQEAQDGECLSFKFVAPNPLRQYEVYSIPFLYTQAGCDRYINKRSWEILASLAREGSLETEEACTAFGRLRMRRELLALYFSDYIEAWSLLGRSLETRIPLLPPLLMPEHVETAYSSEPALPLHTGEIPAAGPFQINSLSSVAGQDFPISAESERFHLEALLGSGGMCEVYAARDLRRVEWGDSEPRVAIKRLLPELRDNRQAQLALAQEFFMLRHLVHPGIVRAFDLHQQAWGPCYSMELLDGSSLHACDQIVLTKNALAIAAQLFEALAFLHAHGIVHGDIKPANLFFNANGRLSLIDFNIATAHSKPGAAASPVGKGIGAGLRLSGYSVLHASPDCLRGITPRQPDDVFSACCSVYEVLSGNHPFNRRSSLEAEEQNLRAAKLKELSGKAWKLLSSGLSFDNTERPNAEDLRQVFAENKSSVFTRFFSSSAS